MGEKDYFPRVESYLGKYQRWKSRLAIIEEELKRLEPKVTSTFSDTPPSVTNKTSDNTGDIGTKRADLIAEREKLLDRVRKIEIALKALSRDQKELFELRYIHHNLARRLQLLSVSESWRGIAFSPFYIKLNFH